MKRLFYNRKMSLSTLLTFLVSTSVILTLLILTYSSYHSSKESLVNTYLSLNYSKAEKMSHSVESLFDSMRTSLENTAAFLEKNEQLSDEEIFEQLELVKNSSGYFNSLSWMDEEGVVRAISPISTGLTGQTIYSGITREVLDAQKPGITAPYVGPSNRLIVLMNQPIYYKDGKYRGMIGGTIYLQEQNVLNQILGNDAIEKNGSYYYVIGPEGTRLFHPEYQLIGESATSNPIVKKLTNGKSGMELVTNTMGIPMLSAYRYMPDIGWGIIQQTPYTFVENLLEKQLQELMMHVWLPFLLLLLFSIYIARKLAAPFIHLANLVNQLAQGKTVSLPLRNALVEPHWNREADLLTKTVAVAFETLEKNNRQLTQTATTDSLTGLQNRRKMDEVLTEWEMEKRSFSLVILDIDHFKSINDTYGHQAGDEALKMLADTVQTSVRKNDHCFRYGGEEFVLLLSDTDLSGALKVAEKIRGQIEKAPLIPGRTVTVSLGIAEFPLHAHSLPELFTRADKALYASKSAGRNRITVASA
ncbi:sensor domain-containing diguanylate cyclase [Planomicrobium sp. CPCC 101079]|uniref:sensor domain-containing diguanylate cyclase n=1 Tax=Planomicrobium sp. CPCC 101079 TaxID=2599618 RepID=UPI0011B50A4F|nr:sensor domain-containing diguanylate cyclase [Planomicrobium sp. CPCC 101079]TWT00530.1 GGDEF domain-containing protein [Planomicrobium sp. CPCC 101079]